MWIRTACYRLVPARSGMALRQILQYPNPLLKQRARPVANIGGDVARLLHDIAETNYRPPRPPPRPPPHPRARLDARGEGGRGRGRGAARGRPPARDRPPRRQALPRPPLAAQAR